EIFGGRDLGIRIFDLDARLVHHPYTYEGGVRLHIGPRPLRDSGYNAHVLRTGETVVINEDMNAADVRFGSRTVPGTGNEKASVFVPLTAGDQVRGLINLIDLEREHAFTES